jgi:predicted MFS family arabinose efflux permease
MPDLVKAEHLTNAVAMNAVASELTVVAGPALGGVLIPVFGMSGAYALIAAIYLVDLVVLVLLKGGIQSEARAHEPPLRSLMSGIRYVMGNQPVLVLLAIAFLMNLLGAPYRYTFLPVFARYTLEAGPTGYGMLTAAAGVGALGAGIWMVALGNFQRKGLLLAGGTIAWPFSLLLFAASKSYALSLLLLLVVGFMQAVVWTLIATLILGLTAQPMRGRVMGLRTGVIASLPFGTFLAGAAAERFGGPLAQGGYAIVAMLLMVAIAFAVPSWRRLD